MVLTQAYRQLARDVLLAYKDIHRCYVAQEVCNVVSHLRLRRRGCRTVKSKCIDCRYLVLGSVPLL